MSYETCPLLNEIPWIKHGFYDESNPCANTAGMKGIRFFNDEYPQAKFLKQDHTDAILTDQDDPLTSIADAMITDEENIALAIKTADCCPVLLVCTDTKQIAAVHAGWPGAVNQITAKTAEKLIKHGARPENIIAAIGPYIHQETFPVQDDVRNKFIKKQPEQLNNFIVFEDRWKMDVANIIKQQLEILGIQKIWVSKINTFTDLNYSSHRRRKDELPIRNVSLIVKLA